VEVAISRFALIPTPPSLPGRTIKFASGCASEITLFSTAGSSQVSARAECGASSKQAPIAKLADISLAEPLKRFESVKKIVELEFELVKAPSPSLLFSVIN
jgi:hypothetical protein